MVRFRLDTAEAYELRSYRSLQAVCTRLCTRLVRVPCVFALVLLIAHRRINLNTALQNDKDIVERLRMLGLGGSHVSDNCHY